MQAIFKFALLGLIAAGPVSAQEIPQATVDAIRAADDENYAAARALAPDAVTRDLVSWMALRNGDGTFADYRALVALRPDWPGLSRLREKGEESIPKGADATEVLTWFAEEAPRTGEGAVRLAEALLSQGRITDATNVIETAWRDLRLTQTGHDAMVAAFPDVLEPHHATRVDNLLWRWRTEEAGWMLDLLPEDQRALATARIAYIRKSGIEDAVKAVPPALRDHPGLAYDRYNWLADQGRRGEAVAILRARSTSADALGEPFRWSGWRRSLARWEMRQGRPAVAYELASNHFLDSGTSYADLEWLSGFLQLTDLDNPGLALTHFDAARAAVDTPISIARMAYWQARAYRALGNAAAADAALREAAQHQTAFYGLLAAEELRLTLDRDLIDDGAVWDPALMGDDLVRAAFALSEAGERGAATQFFVQIGRDRSAADIRAIGAALTDAREVYFAVAMGKAAVTQGKVVPSAYFPLHPLKDENMLVAPELALAIARRESEFNAGVGSPVGALGLMQLMPATAEEVAGFEGVGYSRQRLTGDWRYNARLGLRYLAELEAQFGPSVVQVAAGYNAGPSRPEIWMDERGDPRLGTVDVVDWIEHIPFRETRNYVMRVAESLPVYRARLTGQTGPVRFTPLLRGEKPVVRPVARGQAPLDGQSRLRPTQRPAAPAAPAPLRPSARPSGG